MPEEEKTGEFQIETKGRPLTTKDFDNEPTAANSDKSYGADFLKWRDSVVAKAKGEEESGGDPEKPAETKTAEN